MKTFMGRLAGAVLALAATVGVATAADYRVVSFGDSLSDVGNLFDLVKQPPAPYYQGRFSNGPVWTEILAGGTMRHANAGPVLPTADINFAFGGATAIYGGRVPSVPEQIGSFTIFGGRFAPTDVATVYAGANDLLTLTATSTTNQINAIAKKAADSQSKSLRGLITLGARNIIIPNLPALDKTPRGLANPAYAKVLKTATEVYNARLKSNVAGVQSSHPGVKIILFDVNGLVAEALAKPDLVGLKDTTHPCIAVPACVTGTPEVQNTFLFWDDIHPTAKVHAFVAFMAKWDLEH